MRLCLIEDLAVAGLEPLTLTRPVYELRLGCSNLGTKIATAFGIGEGPRQRGGVVRSHLVPVQHQRDPHVVVNDRDWLARGPVIVANGRWVPPRNGAYIERDFLDGRLNGVTNRRLATLALVGPSNLLSLHETARIDPYTVFDTTNGPIVVGPNVWVQPFTRVEGPCYIGAQTQLFRANIRGSVSIGPNCRIGGEVEDSIVHAFSNKYHEGFLGHAYVGEWVNLGAITSNSDLRNDYGEVFVPLQGDPVATGQAKVGCLIGDHSRTGIGSMLNTGTAIGVMCNVLPAGVLLPKHVPSFTAVLYGRVGSGFLLDQMFATARIVMGRRGKEFTETEKQLYRGLYEQTRLERERASQRIPNHRATHWPVVQAAGF